MGGLGPLTLHFVQEGNKVDHVYKTQEWEQQHHLLGAEATPAPFNEGLTGRQPELFGVN